jgi:hypothetical protein
MSTATIARSASQSTGSLLVFAPVGRGEPLVLLADGSYDTADERVFWRTTPEETVLRVPLDRPVAVRPVHHRPVQPDRGGQQALIDAIRATRAQGPASSPVDRHARLASSWAEQRSRG